jgi:hypothetical protein
MGTRNLIILAAVVIAAACFIYFVERHQPTSDERLERADRIFGEIDGAEMASLELRTSHGPIRLVRADDNWRLVEPIDYPADASAVRSLVDAVAGLDAERTLPPDEVDMGDYGLVEPALSLVLVAEDGRRFSLDVGDETPLGSNRAVRRDADEEIVICSGAFVASLDREIDEWRSRDVVDLFEHDLSSVEIATADDRILVEKENGRWQLRTPVADLADREQMQSLVSELNALRVSEFMSVDEGLGGLDLEQPDYRVVLTPAESDESVTLELWSEATEGAGSMVCRRNDIDLFRVPDSIAARLGKAPVLWRSEKVWPLTSWDVARVEIEGAEGTTVLREIDGMWRLDDGSEADGAEVRRRLNALADLVAREHDLVLPPTEVLGSARLEMGDADTAEEIIFTFFSPMEEGGHAAVRVDARDNVMGVDLAVVETIVGDLGALKPPAADPAVDGGVNGVRE